jgi:hypothetical protein
VVASRRQGHLYYRCASQVGKRAKRCRVVQIRAEPLEQYAWAECLEILEHPEMLTQLGLDHYERLAELDANRAREVSRIQNALAEQAAAKQRIIALVARGKISDHDADDQLDVINAEEARLHGQLNTLETNRNLAGAYL